MLSRTKKKGGQKASFARVFVEVDVSGESVDEILIKLPEAKRVQKVYYEQYPQKCNHCNKPAAHNAFCVNCYHRRDEKETTEGDEVGLQWTAHSEQERDSNGRVVRDKRDGNWSNTNKEGGGKRGPEKRREGGGHKKNSHHS
ncbi:hypothetical protein AAC387_Pa12g0654 [Persea americana]